ncbi:type I glyceraldehyde-3-phosphate dehydrogenase [Amylibacter marinus]|uniref:Type I glyceraldehyde-3-phosphate dehydrogenase n=2 Tax=Amylibacter marinus TaxID=1475483 RepID=A0ABQ5VR08_9RHOB|nr:type I glyceraldehyde-3-phosphate dehydrogenase [Amylibacter marinus]
MQDRAEFDLVGINDIEPLDICAYLFEFDSVYGTWSGTVEMEEDALVVDGRRIPFTQVPDISALSIDGLDVVLECTGLSGDRAFEERGLVAGARNVLVSGPCDSADATVVLGANDHDLAQHKIVSNASCTTNALAPLIKVLDDAYGVESGHMTTVHCYTSSQPTVDQPRRNMARSRAAALSMVPTTTSAHRLLGAVLPKMSGRIEARAIRVPTASVSAIDLTVQTSNKVTVEEVNGLLSEQAEKAGIIGWIDRPLVSSDLRARSESVIMSGLETSVSKGGLLRVFGWYDNEWGFSNRMLDMAARMAAREF